MKRAVLLDVETYPNYFLIGFRGFETGKVLSFELYEGHPLNIPKVRKILREYTQITFNGNNYDIPIVMLALTGADNKTLKAASDWIIEGKRRGWEMYDEYGITRPDWIDHIDLIEVAPGKGSLKLYGGRLHSKKLQDLPLSPDTYIKPAQRPVIVSYNGNDLGTTGDLLRHLMPQIELREKMTETYGIDLRSKSDAQIAEAVIKKMVGDMLGTKISRPIIKAGTVFMYRRPAFLQFKTEQLRKCLDEICSAPFIVSDKGRPIEPEALKGREIRMDGGAYRMGIGGLHSSESSVSHLADDDTILMDVDVTSYYPSIILQLGLFPKHLTDAFLKVYRKIFTTRIEAKRAGNDVIEKVLKIVLNGSFGKFGSMWSVIYSPDLMIQVTVTGQLALLMLIEALALDGIQCVSANTDGIVLKFKRSRLEDVRRHIKAWETSTGFGMEETFYRALYSRDVNNYIAIKDVEHYRRTLTPEAFEKTAKKGWIKGKGAYAETSISKNPQITICVEAVKALLEHGTPIAQTIVGCNDIRKFVTVRTVRGGAVKITKTCYDDRLRPSQQRDLLLKEGWFTVVPGPLTKAKFDLIPDGCGYDIATAYRMHCGEDEFDYIGKVVRFYYGAEQEGALHYMGKNKSGNRNKVPNSDGAVPVMELPDELPGDIDYERYIAEANSILEDIGVWNLDEARKVIARIMDYEMAEERQKDDEDYYAVV